jgi:hypothetical protein
MRNAWELPFGLGPQYTNMSNHPGKYTLSWVIIMSLKTVRSINSFSSFRLHIEQIFYGYALPKIRSWVNYEFTSVRCFQEYSKLLRLYCHLRSDRSCDGDVFGAPRLINSANWIYERRFGVYKTLADAHVTDNEFMGVTINYRNADSVSLMGGRFCGAFGVIFISVEGTTGGLV